jgi:phosphopantothenoylcysteine synthetase/decarboxylase
VRVLVTAGGTEEPVDGVRRLTNTSTGATGSVIARHFADNGADVMLLHAARAAFDDIAVERDTFVSFSDLEAALRRHLGERPWNAVVHLAAVSDYSIGSVEVDRRPVVHGNQGKIASGREVVIRLTPNPKLIDHLREWSRDPVPLVVGFKLTNDPDPENRVRRVRSLLSRGTADLVVHNDLHEITPDRHTAEIWGPDGPFARTTTKEELAETLFGLLQRGPSPRGPR